MSTSDDCECGGKGCIRCDPNQWHDKTVTVTRETSLKREVLALTGKLEEALKTIEELNKYIDVLVKI